MDPYVTDWLDLLLRWHFINERYFSIYVDGGAGLEPSHVEIFNAEAAHYWLPLTTPRGATFSICAGGLGSG